MRLLLVLAAAGAAYWYFSRNRRYVGSTTNASDAVDDIELGPDPTHDETLDAGVKETFPASDPVSVTAPAETAYEKKQRGEL